jgi:hypothetical protein
MVCNNTFFSRERGGCREHGVCYGVCLRLPGTRGVFTVAGNTECVYGCREHGVCLRLPGTRCVFTVAGDTVCVYGCRGHGVCAHSIDVFTHVQACTLTEYYTLYERTST